MVWYLRQGGFASDRNKVASPPTGTRWLRLRPEQGGFASDRDKVALPPTGTLLTSTSLASIYNPIRAGL